MGILAKLKALWKAKGAIKKVQEAYVKDGIKTTEFWLSALAMAQTILETYKGNLDPKTAAIISAVLALGFSIVRAITKSAAYVSAAKVPESK
jgi:hypothetical protein